MTGYRRSLDPELRLEFLTGSESAKSRHKAKHVSLKTAAIIWIIIRF